MYDIACSIKLWYRHTVGQTWYIDTSLFGANCSTPTLSVTLMFGQLYKTRMALVASSVPVIGNSFYRCSVFEGDIYFTQCFRFCSYPSKGNDHSKVVPDQETAYSYQNILIEKFQIASLYQCTAIILHCIIICRVRPHQGRVNTCWLAPILPFHAKPFPPIIVIPSWNTEKV